MYFDLIKSSQVSLELDSVPADFHSVPSIYGLKGYQYIQSLHSE